MTVRPLQDSSVLLVSDDVRLRAIARAQLEGETRHVLTCKLEEVADICKAVRIDIIIALGEGGLHIAKLRDCLASLQVSVRRIVIVEPDPETVLARYLDLDENQTGITRKR